MVGATGGAQEPGRCSSSSTARSPQGVLTPKESSQFVVEVVDWATGAVGGVAVVGVTVVGEAVDTVVPAVPCVFVTVD